MRPTFTLLTAILLSFQLFSQDFDLQWSEKMEYTNSDKGYFEGFIGSNKKFAYAVFNNLALKSKNKNKRIDIVAYDKERMKEVAVLNLRDSDDKGREVLLKGKTYFRTIIHEDIVYVFWEESSENKTTIFVEVYSEKLKKEIALKKVFTIDYPSDVKKVKRARTPIVIISGEEKNDDILIGSEIHSGEGETIQFEYVVLDKKLKEVANESFALPFEQGSKKSGGLTSSYKYGKDGKLYIQSYISLTKEERESLADGEQSAYAKLSVVEIESGELSSSDIRFEGKNVFDFSYVISESDVRVFGFYSDLSIDPKGYRLTGIYFATIDKTTNELSEPIFSAFGEETLNELFKDDQEDKSKTQAWGKKKKEANEEVDKVSLDSRYTIEDIKILENGNSILFCSKMYNYSVTTCTTTSGGGSTCTTRYYCSKSNVTTFALSPEGELVWSTNIDRRMTYSGWNIYDLRVMTNANDAYVIYGSSHKVEDDGKKKRKKKQRAEARSGIDYAMIDMETSDSKKGEIVINVANTEKKDRKYVSPLSISIMDNEFYVSSKRVGYKKGLTALGCVGSVVCFPIIYFVMVSPAFRKGEGYIGKLDLIE